MFSFTIQMEDGRLVPLVQYVVSLAMTEAINYICWLNVSVFYCLKFHLLNRAGWVLFKREQTISHAKFDEPNKLDNLLKI